MNRKGSEAGLQVASEVGAGDCPAPGGAPAEVSRGFTLLELMIVVVVISLLAAIAYPVYINYVTKSHRVAAEGCLSEYANYMERYYATNLSYVRDSDGTTNSLPSLDCASSQQTGSYYNYQLPSSTLSSASYTVLAIPHGVQASRDSSCGTLKLDQSNTRYVTGSDGVSKCW